MVWKGAYEVTALSPRNGIRLLFAESQFSSTRSTRRCLCRPLPQKLTPEPCKFPADFALGSNRQAATSEFLVTMWQILLITCRPDSDSVSPRREFFASKRCVESAKQFHQELLKPFTTLSRNFQDFADICWFQGIRQTHVCHDRKTDCLQPCMDCCDALGHC